MPQSPMMLIVILSILSTIWAIWHSVQTERECKARDAVLRKYRGTEFLTKELIERVARECGWSMRTRTAAYQAILDAPSLNLADWQGSVTRLKVLTILHAELLDAREKHEAQHLLASLEAIAKTHGPQSPLIGEFIAGNARNRHFLGCASEYVGRGFARSLQNDITMIRV